jgi:hypothetical protein
MTIAPPPDHTARQPAPDLQREAIKRVAGVLALHLDGLAARSVGEIWTREPDFRNHVAAPEQLLDSCKVSLGAALASLIDGHLEPSRADRVRDLGRSASQQGIPLEVALRALRIDYLVLWSEMLLVARTTDARTLQSLLNASEPVWAAIDGVMIEFTTGYRSRQDERSRAEAAHRESLVLRLLDGRSVETDEVLEWLTISPTDRLIVVAATLDTPASRDALERVVRYASMRGAWAQRGATTVGIVGLRTEQPTRLRAALARVPNLRAGVSQIHYLGTLVEAGREAVLALDSIRPGTHEIASIFDHPLGVLVAGQPSLAAELSRHFLMGVLERPERERDLLLETLVAFDDADGSVGDVAERLFCHRNTVLNRLAKISRLTGASFTAPSDLTRVALAAQVLRTGGVDALAAHSNELG